MVDLDVQLALQLIICHVNYGPLKNVPPGPNISKYLDWGTFSGGPNFHDISRDAVKWLCAFLNPQVVLKNQSSL